MIITINSHAGNVISLDVREQFGTGRPETHRGTTLSLHLDALSFSIYFPIEGSFKSAKCRRSSALDLTSRTSPRFRPRFDSDRPLHKVKHLQTPLSSRGNTKEQHLILPLAESSQPSSIFKCAARFADVRACAYRSRVNLLFARRISS